MIWCVICIVYVIVEIHLKVSWSVARMAENTQNCQDDSGKTKWWIFVTESKHFCECFVYWFPNRCTICHLVKIRLFSKTSDAKPKWFSCWNLLTRQLWTAKQQLIETHFFLMKDHEQASKRRMQNLKMDHKFDIAINAVLSLHINVIY